MNAIVKELQEAGAWPLDEADLDNAAGGSGQYQTPKPFHIFPKDQFGMG